MRVFVCSYSLWQQEGGQRVLFFFDDLCSTLPWPVARRSCRWFAQRRLRCSSRRAVFVGENKSNCCCCSSFCLPAVYYCCWEAVSFRFFFLLFGARFSGRGDEASHSSVYLRAATNAKATINQYISLSTLFGVVGWMKASTEGCCRIFFLFACILHLYTLRFHTLGLVFFFFFSRCV